MAVTIPLSGKFVALTVYGKNSEGERVAFPSGSTFTWLNDNPVVCDLEELTPGLDSARKVVPITPTPLAGTAVITCNVSFTNSNTGNVDTLTKTFSIDFEDDLPVEVDFDFEVDDL
jgi:hypothetical protein